MIDPRRAAEIRDWTARQERTADERWRNPLTHGNVSGPCLACGRTTANHNGYCRKHQGER